MQVFAGASNADHSWGFGQVAVVVVALGPVVDLLNMSYGIFDSHTSVIILLTGQIGS